MNHICIQVTQRFAGNKLKDPVNFASVSEAWREVSIAYGGAYNVWTNLQAILPPFEWEELSNFRDEPPTQHRDDPLFPLITRLATTPHLRWAIDQILRIDGFDKRVALKAASRAEDAADLDLI